MVMRIDRFIVGEMVIEVKKEPSRLRKGIAFHTRDHSHTKQAPVAVALLLLSNNFSCHHTAMSLSSTSTLKGQLIKNLGPNAQTYFDALSSFVSGQSSRAEFEEITKQVLVSANLRELSCYPSQVANV